MNETIRGKAEPMPDLPKSEATEIQLPNISRKLRRKYFIPKSQRFSSRVNKLMSL